MIVQRIAPEKSQGADAEKSSVLVFYRAPDEIPGVPGEVVSNLTTHGIKYNTPIGRNPITHDQWWIPMLAVAGAPYAKALASVATAWIKKRNARQVTLETGDLTIKANTVPEVEQLLSALVKYAPVKVLHVTKAAPAAKKRTSPKRKKKA